MLNKDGNKPLTLTGTEETRSFYEANGALIYVSSQPEREMRFSVPAAQLALASHIELYAVSFWLPPPPLRARI
jgi:hypothetical protein